jgi:hypothetical protein
MKKIRCSVKFLALDKIKEISRRYREDFLLNDPPYKNAKGPTLLLTLLLTNPLNSGTKLQ